jgi:hypothetical protein
MKTTKTFGILAFLSLAIFCFFNVAVSTADDGVCGSANLTVLTSGAPEKSTLCSSGTPSEVLAGDSTWTWACGSINDCNSDEQEVCTTTDSCAGKKTCAHGTWGACVKDDSSCGNNDYCSDGKWCIGSTGSCENSCPDCPCPEGFSCDSESKSCVGSTGCTADQFQLTDGSCISKFCEGSNDISGTAFGSCSSTNMGKQCVGKKDSLGNIVGLELIDACSICACSGQKVCQNDQTCALGDLPESFSWADKDGVNWMSPVRNQGYCGSCWAFAAVGSLEAMYNIEHNLPGNDINLSEQELVSCGGGGTCSGGWSSSALSYVKQNGIVTENCFPYTQTNSVCEYKCTTPKHGFGSQYANDKDLFHSLYEYGPMPITLHYSETYPGMQNHAVVMIGWTKEGQILAKDSGGIMSRNIEPGVPVSHAGNQPKDTH